MGAAIDHTLLFDSVPDDAATAMVADRREGMNRTLERIERVFLAGKVDFEGLVVIVAASFAYHSKQSSMWDVVTFTASAANLVPRRVLAS